MVCIREAVATSSVRACLRQAAPKAPARWTVPRTQTISSQPQTHKNCLLFRLSRTLPDSPASMRSQTLKKPGQLADDGQKPSYPFNLPVAGPMPTQETQRYTGYRLQPFMYEPYGQRSKQLSQVMSSTSPIPFSLPAPNPHDWRYEMRREAQEIIPRLFLGPFASAKDENWLKAKGITHIVTIIDHSERTIIRPRFPDQLTYFHVYVRPLVLGLAYLRTE